MKRRRRSKKLPAAPASGALVLHDPQAASALERYRATVQLELEKVGRERDRLAAVETKLAARLQAVNVLLEAQNERPERAGEVSVSQSTPIASPSDVSLAARVIAVAERVLGEAGKPLHYRELVKHISQEVPLRGRDPGATLLAYISKSGRLERAGRGIYTLADSATSSPKPKKAKRRRRVRRVKTASRKGPERNLGIRLPLPESEDEPGTNGHIRTADVVISTDH